MARPTLAISGIVALLALFGSAQADDAARRCATAKMLLVGKKIVMAGLWTEACVMFPTLDMLNEGFEIYITADACGDVSVEAHNRAMDRAVQAGAVPITSLQYVFELQQDWARSETYEGVMDILRTHTPYGTQVRFSKWALGEHASEAGPAAHR